MVKVIFRGGPLGQNRMLAPGATNPTEIGGEMNLTPRAIAVLRGMGFEFGSVEDEPLPEPVLPPPPESHRPQAVRQPPRPDIEVAKR